MIRKDEPMNPSNHRQQAVLKSQASSLKPCPVPTSAFLLLLAALASPALAVNPPDPPPVVTQLELGSMSNCTSPQVDVRIYGSGYQVGLTVKLTKAGEPDIDLPDVIDVRDFRINMGSWPIAGAAPGLRDVVVTNPDQQVGTLSDGFEITDCLPLGINSFNLTNSYTCGERTFLMWADGLEPGLTIKLTQAGQPDIVATSIGGIEYELLRLGWVRGVFDLSPGVAGGFWSVVVTNAGGESTTLTDALEVVADCPRGAVGDLYVCNTWHDSQAGQNILQFDGMTGVFVCTFAETPPGLNSETFMPFDLAWAPNGHLWVTSTSPYEYNPKSVVEYDGNTGAFIRYVVPPTTPAEGFRRPWSLSLGGPTGALYMVNKGTSGNPDAVVYRFEDGSPGPPEVVLEPEIAPVPVMVNPQTGRFASNGNFLLLGTTLGAPVPTFREFDGQTLAFVRDLAIPAVSTKRGVIETLDGSSYLVSESLPEDGRVDRYDIATGQLAGTFIPRNPAQDDPQDPMFYQAMRTPWDIAFGPNGHLYVSADHTWVQGLFPRNDDSVGGVHEFDPVTGAQIQVIGHADSHDSNGVGWPADKLRNPHGIEFKPMPGDYASSGGAFGGDWQVDLNDFAKLTGVSPFTGQPVFTGPNVPGKDAHALLSFDFDRDNDLDLKDYAAFQRAFGTTLSD